MIDSIGGFLQHNLVVMLSVVLVPMKWFVLRITGDNEAQAVALLAVPEDICYVTLGLILGDLATSGKAFRRHFEGSSHVPIDIFVTGTFNVAVAVVIHLLAKWGNDHFNGWRAAGVARTRNPSSPGPQQIELPITATDANIEMIQIRHVAVFSISYALQMAIVISWLAWIAKVVANTQ